jgi:hypothetical protein
MLKKVTLLLPLSFNDGSLVPKEVLATIQDEIYVEFRGWTIVGEVEGAYQMQQAGAKRVERLLQVWVIVEEAELSTLKEMVGQFGSRLGQEVMYFEVSDATVEFIPPAPKENSPDGESE